MVRVTKLKLHRTISDIMKKGDLDSLTTKKIRLLCEQKYNVDLSERKSEIDKIVLAFVKKKSKEDDEDEDESTSNQNNVNDEQSSESSGEESAEGESGEESSCSGSESCSNSECSSESSDDESNKKISAINMPAKRVNKQQVASTSKEEDGVETKQPAVIQKQTSGTLSATVPVKRLNKNISAPPKKRMTLQSMGAVADDVAAITAAAAAMPAKKIKPADINNKSHAAAAAPPMRRCANKSLKNVVDDDAEYARKLQAEEWNFRRGTINKLFRDTPPKKNDKNEQTKKKKACPFMKKCSLSPALAEVLGTNEMSRPDIVQKMWSVVRERNLFDPTNKQFILCDEQLANIFGKKRVRLIGMMKHLKQHIKDVNRQQSKK